jgi:hypothetical protein
MTAPEKAWQSSIAVKDRGALVDRTTQRWVKFTGRRVDLDECLWLRGPVGDVDVIGTNFFARLADREGLTVVTDGPPRGLVENFEDLAESACDLLQLDAQIAEFYEQASEYEFALWSEWHGGFRPFGGAGRDLHPALATTERAALSPGHEPGHLHVRHPTRTHLINREGED